MLGQWNSEESKESPETNPQALDPLAETEAAVSEDWRTGDVDQATDIILERMMEWLIERGTVAREEATPDRPLAEFGLDSLTGLELSTEMENWLNLKLNPIVAWNDPTPAELSRYLAEQVIGGGEASSAEVVAPASDQRFDDLLAEFEKLDGSPPEKDVNGNGSATA